MKRDTNFDRAQKIVESWPSWKQDISLTKYSCKSSEQVKAERPVRSDQQKLPSKA